MSRLQFLVALSLCLFSAWEVHAQSRMVFADGALCVMDGGVFLVVDNDEANALVKTGDSGGIVSEDEFNRVRWMIGNKNGAYNLPFAYTDATYLPLDMFITAQGSPEGFIDFSTYGGDDFDNETYMPSMVTQVYDYPTGSVNNSNRVIDRFWVLNPQYFSKPALGGLVFTYRIEEVNAPGNNISEDNLAAQRFNDDNGTWGDLLPVGVVNTIDNRVSTPPIPSNDFFAAWTLVERFFPLPVDLTNFQLTCHGSTLSANWSTATETQSDYFSLEFSKDGENFELLGQVPAAGWASTQQHYTAANVPVPAGARYVRLTQTDFNGVVHTYPPKTLSCPTEPFAETRLLSAACNRSGMCTLNISGARAGNYSLTAYDGRGALLSRQTLALSNGAQQVEVNLAHPAAGAYVLNLAGTEPLRVFIP